MYSYAGSDGKWHSVDLERLKEWARQGHVEPYAPVIETATGKQTRADAIPELQPIFAARFEARAKYNADAAATDSAARARHRKKGTYVAFGTAMVVMIALSVGRYVWLDRQLPLKMPPALPGAVPAPDLAEAGKFTGRWRYTQQTHEPNREATRSSEMVIQPEQRLQATISTRSDITSPNGREASSGAHSFLLQWSQQRDAQGKRLWVVRKNPIDTPTGLYYRFDKAGNELTLTTKSTGALTGTSSDENRDDITGVYMRVQEAPHQQVRPMRKRDMDAQKGRIVK